jgi:hypothetical protein
MQRCLVLKQVGHTITIRLEVNCHQFSMYIEHVHDKDMAGNRLADALVVHCLALPHRLHTLIQ